MEGGFQTTTAADGDGDRDEGGFNREGNMGDINLTMSVTTEIEHVEVASKTERETPPLRSFDKDPWSKDDAPLEDGSDDNGSAAELHDKKRKDVKNIYNDDVSGAVILKYLEALRETWTLQVGKDVEWMAKLFLFCFSRARVSMTFVIRMMLQHKRLMSANRLKSISKWHYRKKSPANCPLGPIKMSQTYQGPLRPRRLQQASLISQSWRPSLLPLGPA
jgi:hypothetical protein